MANRPLDCEPSFMGAFRFRDRETAREGREMAEQPHKIVDPYVNWVLVMTDGKWIPDSKFEGGRVSSALKRAEELDRSPDYEAVKVLRVAKGTGEQKELWVSSRLEARSNAQKANQLSRGVAQTAESLSPNR